MISIEKVDREEGRRRINKGDASALLIVPKELHRGAGGTASAPIFN
jgi:hypothetical protein